jgi:hypothetical protein
MHALPHRDRWHQVARIGFIKDGRQTFTPPQLSPWISTDSIPPHLLPIERYWAIRSIDARSRCSPVACGPARTATRYRARGSTAYSRRTPWTKSRLVTRFGIDHIYFPDDLFTLYEDRVVGICTEILARGLRINGPA